MMARYISADFDLPVCADKEWDHFPLWRTHPSKADLSKLGRQSMLKAKVDEGFRHGPAPPGIGGAVSRR